MTEFIMFFFRKRRIVNLIVLSSAFSGFPVYSVTEFNTEVLATGKRSKVDLSRFSEPHSVLPGSYLLEIKINQQTFPQRTIQYLTDANNPGQPRVCLPPDLIKQMALKPEAAKQITLWYNDACADISALPGITVSNRIGRGVLEITVPQAWMKYSDSNWTPPEQWDNGLPGILLDYNINALTSRQQDSSITADSLTSYGTLGSNAGPWRLRADYQASLQRQGSQRNTDSSLTQVYAWRALPEYAAKVMVGEAYLNSAVFDSFRYTGASVASDERMLPPKLRGYAPEVRGIARSNAKVTVSQQGRTLYETTVPAGPFVIQDLSSSVQGRLEVKVEEQDGSISSFQIDTATIPYLTRPGYVRYNVALGQPSTPDHQLRGPIFSSSDFSWGITNAWSLFGGALIGGDYNAASLGLGRDLNVFGALSADVTQSYARLPNAPVATGKSFRLNYAKRFEDLNSQITFAGYRFSQRNFMNMQQFLQANYRDEMFTRQDKELYTLTANKTFMADDSAQAITVYLSYSHQTYWDSRSVNRYGLSASRMFNMAGISGISASLSAYRSDYQGRTDDSAMLNVTLPLGDHRRIGYSLQTNNNEITQSASVDDFSDLNNSWQLRAGHNQTGKLMSSAWYYHSAPSGTLNANVGWQQDSYTSLGATLRGGVTATRHGIAAHQNSGNGGSRLMLDTDGVAGVPINNGRAYSNRYGLAVISDVSSYYNVDTRIDVNQLSDDVEATRAVVQSTLTEGAIGYRHFEVVQGYKVLATIRLDDGSEPPFGATIMTAKGREAALVNEKGVAYLTGIKPGEKLTLFWQGQPQCTLSLPASEKPLTRLLLPCNAL